MEKNNRLHRKSLSATLSNDALRQLIHYEESF